MMAAGVFFRVGVELAASGTAEMTDEPSGGVVSLIK